MPWVKGQSGNPGGRGKEKAYTNALRAALNVEDPRTRRRKLELVAEVAVEQALLGEAWAVQHVADRLDGKPAQETTLDITEHRYVARMPEKAADVEAWQKQQRPDATLQ